MKRVDVNNSADYGLILEHVPGAIVIDMKGSVIYLNDQCAAYLGVSREASMGQHITKVFPETRMLENMNTQRPVIVFYHSFGAGISVHVPVFRNGKRIGLLEYDVVQASEVLYELADNYTRFLDEQLHSLQRQINELQGCKYSIDDILGKSYSIDKLKEVIRSAAGSDATVLIYGETGTGKELVAHSIHNMSRRAKRSLVKINAANLPENLAESELFGYEGGTFTGAVREGKKGKFEQADKGTLFIDEINQMPLSIQPKLLRVLQEKEIEKLGSDKSLPIDARIIATSNQDIGELVQAGKFREDLFYRLYVIPIVVPPLRERKDDIPLLVDHFVKTWSRTMGKKIHTIEPQVYEKLSDYQWPGNVRELQNVIERAIAFSKEGRICSADIDIPGQRQRILSGESSNPIEEAKRHAERQLIVDALEQCGNNKTKAAQLLKISRPLLYQKMKRMGL